MQRGLDVTIGQPEALGEPVRSRLGQATAVGVNRKGEKELYFVSNGSPATFYVLDLVSGNQTYAYDVPDSDTVWAMAIALDGNVYFSCTSDGILYRYLPDEKRVEVLAASSEDHFVWDIQASSDGVIVSATYPNSKLFEYNIATSQFTDLGRMSEEEKYARGVAITSDTVYTGLGSTLGLIRLDRKSGVKRELHIEGYSGEKGFIDRVWIMNGQLFLSVNKQETIVYDEVKEQVLYSLATAGPIVSAESDVSRYYFVSDCRLVQYCSSAQKVISEIDLPECSKSASIKLLRWITVTQDEWAQMVADTTAGLKLGSSCKESSQEKQILLIVSCYADIWYYDPQMNEIYYRVLDVPLKPLLIQSIETDEEGIMYIGGYHRGLALYNMEKQCVEAELPSFAQIEGIGFLNHKVYFGTYTKANIYVYDKSKPLLSTVDDHAPEANPKFAFPIGHRQDRPFTLTSGDNQLFIGTIPDYGLSTGALSVYHELKDEWTVYPDVAPNLSIVGLAYKEGLLYGGTSIWGGLGKEPVEKVAKVFIWDTVKRELIRQFVPEIPAIDLPPRMIGELSVGPDGNIWGAVDGTIFVMEPVSGKVIRSKQVSPSQYHGKFRPIYLRWGQDGLLYTSLGRKLVIMDPNTLEYEIVEHEPLSIMTLGKDGNLYYGRNSQLYRRVVTRSP